MYVGYSNIFMCVHLRTHMYRFGFPVLNANPAKIMTLPMTPSPQSLVTAHRLEARYSFHLINLVNI